MLRFLVRTVLTGCVFCLPGFIQGGKLMFMPFFCLYNWAVAYQMHGTNTDIRPRSTEFLLLNIALFFAIPAGVALWFACGDWLRKELSGTRTRAQVAFSLVYLVFSAVVMSIAIVISDANQGPIMLWNGDMFGRIPVGDTIVGTALLLALIEVFTYGPYWGSAKTKFVKLLDGEE